MDLPLRIDKEELAAFCRRHHLTKLALFGSVLTDRFGPESDVDVLFEYDPGHVPSLFDVAAMEEELSEILGRKADMRTPRDLSRYFRDEVERTALVQYAAWGRPDTRPTHSSSATMMVLAHLFSAKDAQSGAGSCGSCLISFYMLGASLSS